MPKYMLSGGYGPESWHRMMEHHDEDRENVVGELCRQAGGNLETFYWTFGSDDYVFIADFPDDATAAGVSIAMASTGELHDQRVTKLVSREERQSLLNKAQNVVSEYRRPGG